MNTLGPRVVIAGTHSGAGKTTVATGLMVALTRRKMRVAAAKVGPDFIDPGYHRLATGSPSRNLDAWICGDDAIAALAGQAADQSDILVVEGVMGLFDGALEPVAPDSLPRASTAAIAHLIEAPVILVVDASALSDSVAAIVHGYASLHPDVHVDGVVLNRVGSDAHEDGLRRALERGEVPVLGCLRRDDAFSWRDRHLGLVPVVERPDEIQKSLGHLSDAIERSLDLDAVVRLARGARELRTAVVPGPRPLEGGVRPRIAVAAGRAFSFVYPDNLERLEQAGAEIVEFDPAVDRSLPEATSGLYVGGGFPEVHVEALGDNNELTGEVRTRVLGGLPTWAECGGLLWLSESLDGAPMCGALAAKSQMTTALALGYRRATLRRDTPIGAAGVELRGHEFHYSTCEPGGDAVQLDGARASHLDGYASPTMLATYLHLHLGTEVAVAERFAEAADRHRAATLEGTSGAGSP